jgi:dipeptidyl aminopeptidase/acylaminoacyl peptidase
VVPVAAVSQAGVSDLAAGARDGLGAGAVLDFMGGAPDETAERYGVASPAQLLPLGVTQLLVHGLRDDVVPSSQSRTYAAAASAAGDPVELLEPDADHFDVIDPGHPGWRLVAARLPILLVER